MSIIDGGRVARAAGLVITTAISTAEVQSSMWSDGLKMVITFVVICVGAFAAAMAADFGEGK